MSESGLIGLICTTFLEDCGIADFSIKSLFICDVCDECVIASVLDALSLSLPLFPLSRGILISSSHVSHETHAASILLFPLLVRPC
jgi:hypothetical protein